MKIVKVAQHSCFRVQKQAMVLLKMGHDVNLITHKIPSYADQYSSVSQYFTNAQMNEAIRLHDDADIFHCHNEPNWLVDAVKGVFPDKPVVMDVHDSMLVRYSPDDEDPDHVRISVNERDNFQLADGLVFVGQEMADVCRGEYNLQQPYAILASYVPQDLYHFDAFRWLGGIVYEGRVDLPEKQSSDMAFFTYSDYRDLAREFHKNNIDFHLFAPNRKLETLSEVYGDTAIPHEALPVGKLFRCMGSHNWGLLGNLTQHEAWKYAMPNKLFDYLAAGTPIIAMNAKCAGDFVERHGFGINVTSVKEIIERWGEHREARNHVKKHRYEWAMERHIHHILKLYEEVRSPKLYAISKDSPILGQGVGEENRQRTSPGELGENVENSGQVVVDSHLCADEETGDRVRDGGPHKGLERTQSLMDGVVVGDRLVNEGH